MFKKCFLFIFSLISAYAYDVMVVAHPIIDRKCQVNDTTFQKLVFKKGECSLITHPQLERYISDFFSKDDIALAGSAFNVIKGLTKLGNDCAAIGVVGTDQLGTWIEAETAKLGISFIHNKVPIPTSQCLCFITPDKERTMLTYVGASVCINEDLLNPKDFENLKFFHLEGYQIFQDKLAEAALKLAKKNHAIISISLASPDLSKEKKNEYLFLFKNYADIVFCNEHEAIAISDQKDPIEACKWLAKYSDIVVVTQGKNGGILYSQGETIFFKAKNVEAKDTTGAGDLFSSGFIDAYLKGKSLKECLISGRNVAAKVVSVYGVDIPDDEWNELKNSLKMETN